MMDEQQTIAFDRAAHEASGYYEMLVTQKIAHEKHVRDPFVLRSMVENLHTKRPQEWAAAAQEIKPAEAFEVAHNRYAFVKQIELIRGELEEGRYVPARQIATMIMGIQKKMHREALLEQASAQPDGESKFVEKLARETSDQKAMLEHFEETKDIRLLDKCCIEALYFFASSISPRIRESVDMMTGVTQDISR